jgi:phenylpropionate dioxygenase-like ring-hydroxylating dioxygenase large terminal subunit
MNNPMEARAWGKHYPELGTGPLPVEPMISPARYAQEREHVFRPAWLCVGRVEDVPEPNSYFTATLPDGSATLIVARGEDGQVRAFHNTCRHRGGRVALEPCGKAKGWSCPLHGWTFDTSGRLAFLPDEEEFYDLPRARLRLVGVHCAVWEGFIFVCLADEPPAPLETYLGQLAGEYRGYFDGLTEVAHYTMAGAMNWKLMHDVSVESYHVFAIHPIHPVSDETNKQVGVPPAKPDVRLPTIQLFPLHRRVTVPGNPFRPQSPVEQLMVRYNVVTSFTFPEAVGRPDGHPPGINPGNVPAWSFDVVVFFPNFLILTGRGLYVTINMWPQGPDRSYYDTRVYMKPAANMAERVAQEAVIAMTRDVMREDFDHVEPQHLALASGGVTEIYLSDQELAPRHNYAVLDAVIRRGFKAVLGG